MIASSSASFCKLCQPQFSANGSVILEDQKEEETQCTHCAQPATLLYCGQPSCFSCYKIQKSQKQLMFKSSHHLTKKSQDCKSLSPKKSRVLESNCNIKSLNTMNLMDKVGKVETNPRIKSLRSDEEIVKDTSPETKGKTKRKSVFKKANTLEFPSPALPLKQSLSDFIDIISKKGLDPSTALFHAKEGNFSSKIFHEKCDFKENLVIVIIFSSGFILGTYQETPLDPANKVVSDEKAVIFSLFGGEKVFYYEIANKKFKYDHSGFSFGAPIGLLINFDVIDESFCSLELKYKSPLGGDVKFKIAENFVWSLIIKEILAFKLS